jgi:hypothetical protein
VRRRLLLTTVAVLAIGMTGCGGGGEAKGAQNAAATTALPANFFGVVAPELLPANTPDLDQALDAQAKAGVELIRQPFLWQDIEPTAGRYDFKLYDRLVGQAAHYGLTVMPIVFGVPKREASKKVKGANVTATTTMPPKSNARFAKFAAKLVRRYGTDGQFWADNPDLPAKPITAWQVWNEPNLRPYWGGRPDPKAYAKLLRATAPAIRKADPAAQVLTAGLPESKIGIPLTSFIKQMVTAGAAGSFDVLAVHPYSLSVAGALAGAVAAQKAATPAGGAKPALWITEIGWATKSSGGYTVSETKQAQLVSGLMTQAAARRTELNLRGVVYFAWRDSPVYAGGKEFWGLHTGLVNRDNTVKPALTAYAAALKTAKAAAGG